MMVVVRVIVSLLLIAWVVHFLDRDALLRFFDQSDPFTLLITTSLILMAMLAGAWRWWMLARESGVNARPFSLLPGYFVGVFFNNIMPVTIGGDIARTVFLSRRGYNLQSLITSAILDRWFGLLSVLLTVTIAMLVRPGVIGTGQDALLGSAVALLFMMSSAYWLLVHKKYIGVLHACLGIPQSIVRWVIVQSDHLKRCQQSLRFVFLVLAISVASQGCITLAYFAIGYHLGIPVVFFDYLVIVPAIMLAQTLPISMAGLGVREAASVWLFSAAGASEQQAAFLSLTVLCVLWIVAVPGGVAALLGRWKQ